MDIFPCRILSSTLLFIYLTSSRKYETLVSNSRNCLLVARCCGRQSRRTEHPSTSQDAQAGSDAQSSIWLSARTSPTGTEMQSQVAASHLPSVLMPEKEITVEYPVLEVTHKDHCVWISLVPKSSRVTILPPADISSSAVWYSHQKCPWLWEVSSLAVYCDSHVLFPLIGFFHGETYSCGCIEAVQKPPKRFKKMLKHLVKA